MSSTYTGRLVRLPVQALAILVASIMAAAVVWYGGQSLLHWLGFANPARGDTGTALGLSATAIGSSIVPGWLTARDYFVGKGEPMAEKNTAADDAPSPDETVDAEAVSADEASSDESAADGTTDDTVIVETVEESTAADASSDTAVVNAPRE